MNVKIAGHDRPVRAPGALPSPIGLLPASENAKWVGMLVSFALGLILSTAHIAGSPAPFGLAFLAAMGYGSGGALCLAGCALGYFAAFGVATGTQLAAGCCLIFLTAYFLRSHPFVQTRWYPSAVSAAAYILTRLVLCLLTGGLSLLLVSRMVLFLLLCAASAYGFDDLLRAQEPRTVNAEICRNVSTVFLLACLLMGVNNLLLFDTLSVGRALSVLILLILSGTGGALCGASAGLILGIAMDVAAGAGVLFSVVYAAAGLLSGQFCKHRRGFYLLIFAAAYLLTLFCIPLPELRIGAGVELALAMGAYLVIPKKFVVAVGAFLQPLRGGSGESGLRRYVAGRVGGVAHAYQQLHDTACQAASTAENDADVAKVFDRAADRVCCRCKLQQECWTRRALDTLNIMNDVTRRIQARGRLLPEDFPPYFADRCVRFPKLLGALDGQLHDFLQRRLHHGRLDAAYRLAREQYRQVAEVLSRTAPAERLRRAHLTCRTAALLRPKTGEKHCGDQCAVFDAGGLTCLALSDGMGSGESAHCEAAMTIRLLRQFLQAGIEPLPALKTLNTAAMLRCQGGAGFTTIDLACLDRAEGVLTLYKYGAAPSYIKRQGAVARYRAQALPAGLESADGDVPPQRVAVSPGSWLVQVSDGVAGEDDEWLQDLLAGWDGTSPRVLAEEVLRQSVQRTGGADDCAVLVLAVESREDLHRI